MIRNPGCACDIGDDMVELEVHLGQRLLHVLNMRGRILEQTLALTYVGTQRDEMTFGPKAGAQQTVRMKPLQPLCIADVGFAPGHVLGVAGIDKEHRKATGVEKLVDRNPVDAGRFHRDGLDAAFCKPSCQPMQIGRESPETADRLWPAIRPDGGHQ